MSTGDQGEPLAAERDDQSDRGHDGAIDGGVCNELPPKPQRFIRTPHGVRPVASLEGRVIQSGLPVDENSSSAAMALHYNPTTNFILPNDELRTCIPAASFPSFADIRGNGHFHACGDAIWGVDRGDHVQQCRIKDRYGKKPTGIKIL
jgi:hypothetical protein